MEKKTINDEKLLEKLGIIPHEGQQKVLEAIKNEAIRDIVLVCGRRWGKSFLMAYTALRELLLPDRKVWIVAPTSDLTQKVFTELIKFIGKIYEAGEYNITTKPYPKIVMANGSLVECKTADNPVSLIGDEVNLLIIDEAARIPPMVYDRELAATTMTRKGRTVFISTPKGLNWFYVKYKNIEKEPTGFVYNAPSSQNPKNSEDELDKQRKSLPEAIFNQEYLAMFIDEAGAVFRNIMDIVNDDCYEEPKPEHRYVIGCDWAKLHDYTVMTVIDKQTHKVVAWERMNKVDYGIQKQRLVALARKYNHAKIIVDSTGVGNPVTEDIKRERLFIEDFKFTNKSKNELILKLNLFIEEKAITIPNNTILIDELKAFGMDIGETGTIKYGAPTGLNDDCVCSLALAVWDLYKTEPQKKVRPYEVPQLKERAPIKIHR